MFVACSVGKSLLLQSQLREPAAPLPSVGPYLVHAVGGGGDVKKRMPPLSTQDGAWTVYAWIAPTAVTLTESSVPVTTLYVRNADTAEAEPPARRRSRGTEDVPEDGPAITLALRDGRPAVTTPAASISAPLALTATGWHLLLATGDRSHLALFVDGQLASDDNATGLDLTPFAPLAPSVVLAPRPQRTADSVFRGRLAFTFAGHRTTPAAALALWSRRPALDTLLYEENAKPWHEQVRQQVGYTAPQTPDAMPHGAPAAAAVAKPLPPRGPTLQPDGPRNWTVSANWKLFSNDAGQLTPAEGERISQPGFNDAAWLAATIPGTVLTTLVDRGVYPDPDYGLNNLSIPESLNKHDYWYRVTFPAPAKTPGAHIALHFAGINYSADVWCNGKPLGSMKGAFRRGDFDITPLLKPDGNVLAVRIVPPQHPGIPQEQSIRGGPGDNGGEMLIDGPTFVASEGWDWIPAMRDRNSGIWQPVTLTESGSVTLDDPQVITRLPLPSNNSADVEIHVAVHNSGTSPQHVDLAAEFEGVHVLLPATVPPGDTTLHLLPSQFTQLHLDHPRLWWPNGYGKPDLYHLSLTLADALHRTSDTRKLTFGVREISYELSLFDHEGELRRVEAIPTVTAGIGANPVDVTHSGMRHTDAGAASSITLGAEGTPAIVPVTNEPGFTDLVLKVNGVRIAVRGGNWGMDDARKRVSREKLEPYFRLHQEANLNMIRNWVGQDTEETFFQLADEYGMLVWNDFWASTENYNAEPGDPELFAGNARDTVRHFRNHPSIAVWCGRNEGVPPPVLNEKLIALLREEDGTRLYSPSSNQVNLRGSGPYSWEDPAFYYTHNLGFSVELGISSFPTLESFEGSMPKSDQWPVSDDWAYHDWHQSGGGDTHRLMQQVEAEFGSPTSLPDFERTLQMFNYVDHRAIFEGFYQHLWQPNSGRMIWMTHPAWPSTMWQMYSADYDTQASFYGIKKANEPLHVQMDLSDGRVAAINTTQSAVPGASVTATVSTLGGKPLHTQTAAAALPANTVTPLFLLPLASLYGEAPAVLVRLTLQDSNGQQIANNTYWLAREAKEYRALRQMPIVPVQVRTHPQPASNGEAAWSVELANTGSTPALAAKLTLLQPSGERILPAYYSDNYIALLPGEHRTVTVRAPLSAVHGTAAHFSLRGWNVTEAQP